MFVLVVCPGLPGDGPGESRFSSRWSWWVQVFLKMILVCPGLPQDGPGVVWRCWQVFLFTFMNPVEQGLTCDWRSCCLCSGTALKTDTPGVWGTRGRWYWRTGRALPSRRHMLEITSQTRECFLGSLKCWTFGRSSSTYFQVWGILTCHRVQIPQNTSTDTAVFILMWENTVHYCPVLAGATLFHLTQCISLFVPDHWSITSLI